MKKIIYTFTLLFLTNISSGQNPQAIFKSHLKVIEKFVSFKMGESVNGEEISPSIIFLEDLTGIECDQTQGFVFIDEPSKKNLKDWKTWFRKNKEYLFWNEVEKKVMVSGVKPK